MFFFFFFSLRLYIWKVKGEAGENFFMLQVKPETDMPNKEYCYVETKVYSATLQWWHSKSSGFHFMLKWVRVAMKYWSVTFIIMLELSIEQIVGASFIHSFRKIRDNGCWIGFQMPLLGQSWSLEAGTLFSSEPGTCDLHLSQSVPSIPLATMICFPVNQSEPTSFNSTVYLSDQEDPFPTTLGIVWCW